MAAKAKALVARADAGEVTLEILPLIFAETIYTLESFYEMDRKEVATKLLSLLETRAFKTSSPARLRDALERHRDYNVHFADAYVAAAAKELNLPIASFDRDLDKFKDVTRVAPG
jgi:predicted nucleic acid-binding protein